MRPPTGNTISQGKHGLYNAVDYHSSPDVYVYAPEDGTITAWLVNAGDAGNELMMQGAHGRHGFCHCEETYVHPGQKVSKGQKLAKMGYTGLTDPVGPLGRHLHWVILQLNNVYVYPPTLITEPFGGSEQDDDMIITQPIAELLTLLTTGWPNPKQDGGGFVNSLLGQQVDEKGLEKILNTMLATPQRRDLINAVNAPKALTPEQQSAVDAFKKAFK